MAYDNSNSSDGYNDVIFATSSNTISYPQNSSIGVINGSSIIYIPTIPSSDVIISGAQVQVYSGGTLVRQGEVLTGEVIDGLQNDSMFVYAGGIASSATIRNDACMYVSSGGVVSHAIAESFGMIDISAGGWGKDVVVSNGGCVWITGEEYAPSTDCYPEPLHAYGSNVTVLSGGYCDIYAGEVTNLIVSNGGVAFVGGLADPQFVDVNAVIFGGEIKSGGSLTIGYNGAELYGSVIFGGTIAVDRSADIYGNVAFDLSERTVKDQYIVDDITGLNLTMSGSFSVTVTANQAEGTYILAGNAADFNTSISVQVGTANCGTVTVGGTACSYGNKTYSLQKNGTNLVFNIGNISSVGSSGFVSGSQVQVYSSGTLVKQGKVLTGEKLIGGTNDSMFVYSGGTANSTLVSSGSLLHVSSGGVANSTTAQSQGYLLLYSGGRANDTLLTTGGIFYIYSGGYASNTTMSGSGNIYISGSASNVVMLSGGSIRVNGGVVNNVVLTGGKIRVNSGGIAEKIIVNNALTGTVNLFPGGKINDLQLGSGGHAYLRAGGVATKIAADAGSILGFDVAPDTVFQGTYGGKAFSVADGMLDDYEINSRCHVSVFNGGNVNSISVLSAGNLVLCENGTGGRTVVSSGGGLIISSGGKHRLTLKMEAGAFVSAYQGSIVDFTVSERSVSDGYLINNLALIQGTPTYTITVKADQNAGTYKLAQGAENFSGTLTIGDGTTNYGSITVNGNDLVYNGVNYSLDQADGNLTLTLGNTGSGSGTGSGSSIVSSGSQVQVYSSGALVRQGKVLTGEKIYTGQNNSMFVYAGGTASSATIFNEGIMYVSSGGLTSRATAYNGGRIDISAGGRGRDVVVSNGGCVWITGEEYTSPIDFYPESLHAYGSNVTVLSGGYCDIYAGEVTNLIVSNGGEAFVGGLEDPQFLNVDALIFGGEVKSGGSLTIGYAGAELCDSVIFGGTITVTGYTNVYGNVAFDLSERTVADDCIVDNIAGLNLTMSGSFSVTVTADQAEGTYILAGNAADFNTSISVQVGTANCGTVTVDGTTCSYGDKTYSLQKNGTNLVFNIGNTSSGGGSGTYPGSSSGGGSGTYPGSGIVSSGAQVQVYSSGTLVRQGRVLTGETIISGGNNSMFVYAGGTANSTTVNSKGQMEVSSGGSAVKTAVNNSGVMFLYGGTANSTTVDNGKVYVKSGGIANSTTAANKGTRLVIESGGAANHTILTRNAYMLVYSGATASDTVVNDQCYFYLWDGNVQGHYGGKAYNTLINAGGEMNVIREGVASNTTVWGKLWVSSGRAIDTIVHSGGSVLAASNGTVTNTVVNSAGHMYLYGTAGSADFTVVNSGGSIYSETGGVISVLTVNSGGEATFNGGTLLSGKHTYGGSIILTGPIYAPNASIIFDLTQRKTTDSYIVKDFMHLNAGSYSITVSANQTDGTYILASNSAGFNKTITVGNGTVNFGSVSVGGNALTYNNKTYSLQLNGADLVFRIGTGGTGNSGDQVKVYSSGTLVRQGKVLTGETIISGGNNSMFVYAGGTAGNTLVNSSGFMYVSGGSASNTTLRGAAYVTLGPNQGGSSPAPGVMNVYNGGTVSNTCIYEGGQAYIYGGTINDTAVYSHGKIWVTDNGTANNITTDKDWCWVGVDNGGEINNITNVGGSIGVFEDGIVNNAVLNGGANTIHAGLTVYTGGIARNTIVNDMSFVTSSGATADKLTVNYNGLAFFYKDAILAGSHVYGGSVILFGDVDAKNADITFDVSQRKTTDKYIVDDLSCLNAKSYSITVSANQAEGTYILAAGADSFTGTISIGTDGSNYGSLITNGAALKYNGVDYSLVQANGNLTLTVGTAVSGQPSGDKNGVSFSGLSGNKHIVEFSKNNFVNVLTLEVTGTAVDIYNLPKGTHQWQVDGVRGNDLVEDHFTTAQTWISDADGVVDLFWTETSGVWKNGYAAEHQGSGSWQGTGEQIILDGKNKIADVYKGSTDANVLVLTDDANGDALFIDDVYTTPGNQVRLTQIDEIRAGIGDDIVDLTSQQFDYAGNGIKVYGGAGDDTIWANSGNNILFGDDGNDRLVGANGDDILTGGAGNDSMHGGGGNDTFCFGANWGQDTVEQLAGGSVTLHFENGSKSNWNADTLTYSDGVNSVTVSGVTNADVTLVFGVTAPVAGAFLDAASEKIFEDKNKGMIA